MFNTSRGYQIPENKDRLEMSLENLQATFQIINVEQDEHDRRLNEIEAGQTWVVGEQAGGDIDGVNVIFTTLQAYQATTIQVFLNGLKLRVGNSNDYIETGSNEFTMNYAPLPDDYLEVTYIKD